MPVVATPVLARQLPLQVPTCPFPNGFCVLEYGHGLAPAHIKSLEVCALILEHQHVRIHDIIHMNEVTGLAAIFINHQRLPL